MHEDLTADPASARGSESGAGKNIRSSPAPQPESIAREFSENGEADRVLGCFENARALLEAMPVGVCVCDPAGSRVFWHNQAARNLWGGPPQGAIDGQATIETGAGQRVSINGTNLLARNAAGRVAGVLNILQNENPIDRALPPLTDAEAFRRLALESTGLGTFELDFASSRLLWSDRTRQIFGAQPGIEPEFDLLLRTIHPGDRARFEDVLRVATDPAGNGRFAGEFRIVAADGAVRWAVLCGAVAFEQTRETRRPLRLFGAALDVTENKRTHARLLESDLRVRLALAAANMGVWELDLETGVETWSTPFAPGDAGEAGEPAGSDAFVIPPEDVERMRAAIRATVETDAPYDVEYRRIDSDGRVRWIHSVGRAIRDENGKALRLTGVAQDVTERKSAQAALQEANDRLETLINASPLPIVTFATDGNITRWNPAAERVFGWSEAEVLGKPLPFIPPEKLAEHQALRARDLRGENFTNLELQRRRKDGSKIDIQVSTAPIRNAQGEITGILSIYVDVTGQKRIQRELENSEARLRLALEAGHMGAWEWDVESNTVVWSEGLTSAMGFAPAEGPRTLQEFLAIVHPEDRAHVQSAIQRSLETDAYYNVEFRVTAPGGTRWVARKGRAVRDASGRPVRMIGVGMDVTERKRTEEALRASEEKFRTIYNVAAVGIAQTSVPDGRYISVNRRFAEITGYAVEELIGKTFLEITHPEDRAGNEALYFRTMRSPLSEYTMEKRYIRKDGAIVWANVTISFVRDESGAPLYTIGVIEDITERKLARMALEESEQRQRLAVDAGRIGLWDWDVVNNRVNWSDQIYEFHGIPPGGFSGKVEDFISLIHPEDRGRVWERIQCALAGEPYQIEFRVVQPGGQVRWLTTNGAVLFDGQRRPLRMFGATVDVTERKAAENELQRVNDELRRANADLQQFAYAAAHDLQEPLRNIALYAQLLAMRYEGQLDEQGDEILAATRDSAVRMQMLVQDLLTYAHVAGGDRAAAAVDCNAVLQAALRNLDAAIVESGAVVTSGPLPEIRAHESNMIEVFQNLIGNAIKYRGPRLPRIHVSAEQQSGVWIFSISDNGMGIPPEYQDRIFGVFKRLHGREIAGTGIGLAICKRIVERYGGRIWVESAGEGKGATFRFTIPQVA
jgi:PAS domain S-box-containing protein